MAIKVEPGYSLAYFNAANLYFQNRQFQQAREYLDQAIRFDNKDEAAFLNRGICKVSFLNLHICMSDYSAIPLNVHLRTA